jgi:hypothetical protein
MFTPVDPAIKEKVISAYLTGKGRNQITRELHEQGVRVSHGSISNIIGAYKRKHEQPKPSPNGDDAGVPMNICGPEMRFSGQGSPLFSRIGQVATTTNDVMPRPTDVQKQEPIHLQEIDFDDIPVDPDVFTNEVDYNPEYDGVEGEHRFNYQYANTMNRYPNSTFPNTNILFPNTNIPFPNSFSPYPNIFDQHVFRHVVEETKKEESDQTSTSKNILGMDWDENHEARFVKWVLNQKSIRQKEERKLEERWGLLVNERNSLEEQKRNLEAREAKLSEVKDLISSAGELKSMGIEFTHAIAWINVIREYASKKMVDERTAVWRLAEDLKNWQELGGMENAIQNAKNQLALLNMTLEDQKAAIATLVNLQRMGMSEIEISRLVKLVNGWGKGNSNFANGLELDSRLNLQNTPQ